MQSASSTRLNRPLPPKASWTSSGDVPQVKPRDLMDDLSSDLAETLLGMGHHVEVLTPAEHEESLTEPWLTFAGRTVPVPYNGSIRQSHIKEARKQIISVCANLRPAQSVSQVTIEETLVHTYAGSQSKAKRWHIMLSHSHPAFRAVNFRVFEIIGIVICGGT